jgi:hypothetical protein
MPSALEQLLSKSIVTSPVADSAAWASFPLALAERAFFSSKVAHAALLAEAQKQAARLLDGSTDRAQARVALKQILGTLGAPDSGDLTDLSSDRRLNLILDMNSDQAAGYARFAGEQQDEDFLLMYPCQELLRAAAARQPRDWGMRWADAGGEFFSGRMIARKDSPVWTGISRFGTPWPPYDFGSHMDVVDISRDEAVRLGVIAQDERIKPQLPDFNAKLEASVSDPKPELLASLRAAFGDQASVERSGKVRWQGERILKLYESALADETVKWTLALGQSTASAAQKASAAGGDIAGRQLLLDADHLRHIQNRHGEAEKDPSQRPVTAQDLRLLPFVWREPDTVEPGERPGDLVFKKELNGTFVAATWSPTAKGVRLRSLFIKKGGSR